MGPLGVPELIFILLLALLIFGPKRLPEIGRTLGRAMGEFRRATTDLKRTIDTEISTPGERPTPPGGEARPAIAAPPEEKAPAPAPESPEHDSAPSEPASEPPEAERAVPGSEPR